MKTMFITAISMTFLAVRLMAPRAQAGTITVTSTNDSGAGTLRAALASAADGDAIDFSVTLPATIFLTNGELLITNSVSIVGPGPAMLTVRANTPTNWFDTANRVFRIAPSNNVNISSVSISGTSATGGGIHNDHATLTVSNCNIGGNWTYDSGGAIHNDGSGGVATLRITCTTISGNQAGNGGGIYNDGSGGAATLDISYSTFSGNGTVFPGSGGAIYNDGSSGNTTLKVSNCTFNFNLAFGGSGGGIYNDGSGGNAAVQVSNSTFVDNEGQGGGGIHNNGSSGTATLEIGNTILKAYVPGVNIFNDSGGVTSRGYNLSSDAAGGDATTNPGGLLNAPGDQRNTEPLLDPAGLQDHGGPTLTIALLPGSPAIDQGKRDTIATLASDTEQRGFPRPFDDPAVANAAGGDGSDIGAFESPLHDLAVIRLKAPKVVKLKPNGTARTKRVVVTIQNRSAHVETIPDLSTLSNLVQVTAQSLGTNCAPLQATFIMGPPNVVPRTIKSKSKLDVFFSLSFDCANDPVKGFAHEDYSYTASVNHAAIDGIPDTHAGDDVCPRAPLPGGTDRNPDPNDPTRDRGCGGRNPDGTLGAEVLTDVVAHRRSERP